MPKRYICRCCRPDSMCEWKQGANRWGRRKVRAALRDAEHGNVGPDDVGDFDIERQNAFDPA